MSNISKRKAILSWMPPAPCPAASLSWSGRSLLVREQERDRENTREKGEEKTRKRGQRKEKKKEQRANLYGLQWPAVTSVRAGNHRLSAMRALTNPPYRTDLPWQMLRALNRQGPRTVAPADDGDHVVSVTMGVPKITGLKTKFGRLAPTRSRQMPCSD